MAVPPPMRLRVAVGLKQAMVEIDAYPDTTWESAKLEACAAAGDLDATAHRLLFRGRERAHTGIAKGHLDRMAEELADVGKVELRPKMEGYRMIMVLAPIGKT